MRPDKKNRNLQLRTIGTQPQSTAAELATKEVYNVSLYMNSVSSLSRAQTMLSRHAGTPSED
ncbi:hypothetical protein TRICHSKD4_1775 [Roseibium sp. TrichSKD4]|nr:hypothetical protein TRICHSKD4_1775 [Roseibium sp. TrichSKD4]